jgi:Spy/CpxP family protein refolding chaperone
VKMKITPVPVVALTLALALWATPFAHAEKTPADTPVPADQSEAMKADPEKTQKIVEKTAATSETLDSLRDDITKLNADLQKAKDEDLVVLRDQRRRKYFELRDELEGLVNNIIELEAAGQETREARKLAAASAGQVSGKPG